MKKCDSNLVPDNLPYMYIMFSVLGFVEWRMFSLFIMRIKSIAPAMKSGELLVTLIELSS